MEYLTYRGLCSFLYTVNFSVTQLQTYFVFLSGQKFRKIKPVNNILRRLLGSINVNGLKYNFYFCFIIIGQEYKAWYDKCMVMYSNHQLQEFISHGYILMHNYLMSSFGEYTLFPVLSMGHTLI